MHTTHSDGSETEEVMVHKYRDAGYDFVAISDHRHFFNSEKFNTDSFLVLPYCEMDTGDWEPGRALDHHLHCLRDTTQKSDNELTYDEVANLEGYFAMEIYNHLSEVEEAGGYSVDYYDLALQAGKKIFAVAADDNHGGDGLEKAARGTFFGGWIMVQAEVFSVSGIITALKEGKFYSSIGPEIIPLYSKKIL